MPSTQGAHLFKKGNKIATGRPKGLPNQVTMDVRTRYKEFVEGNLDKVDSWMQRVAESDPDKALEFMIKFSEYFIPKMQRVEMTGKDGDNLTINVVAFSDHKKNVALPLMVASKNGNNSAPQLPTS